MALVSHRALHPAILPSQHMAKWTGPFLMLLRMPLVPQTASPGKHRTSRPTTVPCPPRPWPIRSPNVASRRSRRAMCLADQGRPSTRTHSRLTTTDTTIRATRRTRPPPPPRALASSTCRRLVSATRAGARCGPRGRSVSEMEAWTRSIPTTVESPQVRTLTGALYGVFSPNWLLFTLIC
jgi:hypothetical protein